MSYDGKKTPLQLNAESGLGSNQGLTINVAARKLQGKWLAAAPYNTPTTASYTQGTVTSTTILNKLTTALPLFYELTPGTLSVEVWRNLLTIGRPPSNTAINCPALGNSRPDTFQTTWAGYGSFKSGSTIDQYGNTTTSAELGLVEDVYPPKNYPADGVWSYVYNNWSSISGVLPQTPNYHQYSWITGWPGAYAWQSKESGNPQTAPDPVASGDTYAAAYFPRPDLAGVQAWRSRDADKIEYDEYFRHGFIATVARQAYYEIWANYKTRRVNQYPEFLKAWQQSWSYKNSANNNINTVQNSKTFLKGNYSGINDLSTSDWSGVNQAFKSFGNDMAALGKAVDLSTIHLFGLPSKFLLNLQKNNALTESLRLALLYSGLTVEELSNILLPNYTPGVEQEKRVWESLLLITGQDLDDIKLIINCSTAGLTTLGDLINPQKMFPNSYRSLTVPSYNVATNSSKNYSLIYTGNGVNTNIPNWGKYLENILPDDLVLACGAFMMAINQVKNIRQMDFEKVSQVVSNLETVDKGCNLLGATSGVPSNVQLVDKMAELTALGSGTNNVYQMSDFFGAMSGVPYVEWYQKITGLLNELATPALDNIYGTLLGLAQSGVFTSQQIQDLIDSANAEIAAIQANNAGLVGQLNYWWDKVGTQLAIEQRAIPYAIPKGELVYTGAGSADIDAFIKTLEDYALDTGQGGASTVLEAVCDTASIGGQSLLSALREARNAKRIINAGGELDNSISNSTPGFATLDASVVDGKVEKISTNGSTGDFTNCDPPKVTILPQGGVFGTGNFVQSALNISTECKFIGSINDHPGIVDVKPGWTCSIGIVSSATVNGSNYEIIVAGACFEEDLVYTFLSPQLPPGRGASAVAVADEFGNVAEIKITNSGVGYQVQPTILVDGPPPPVKIGGPVSPGSLAGSPYTGQDPVPDNLVVGQKSSYTVNEAIKLIN